MSLQQLTARHFGSGSRIRGKIYFERGSVNVVKTDIDARAEFRVRGADLYKVTATFTPNQREVFFGCSCPNFKANVLCKHIWAAVLKSDELQLFPSLDLTRPIAVHLQEGADRDPTDATKTNRLPRGTERKNSAADPDSTSALPHWRQSIEKAEKKTRAVAQEKVPVTDRVEANKLAHFALDIGKSVREGRINLRFLVQEYLKNGSLGAVKQTDLTQDSIAYFPEAQDRKILWDLLGKTETSGYYSNFYVNSRGAASATVPLEHAQTMLLEVSRPGRVYIFKTRGDDAYLRGKSGGGRVPPFRSNMPKRCCSKSHGRVAFIF